MSEKNLFDEMMANNPYLSMSEDNPFMAMLKNNPYLSMSDDNPFLAMLKNNPFLPGSDDNPLAAMMKDNPFLAMFKDNPMLAEDNPFMAMLKGWAALCTGENPCMSMAGGIPTLNLYDEMQQAAMKFLDIWLVSLGSLSWTQNQIENATRKQLSDMKAVREDLARLTNEIAKQAARNQAVILEVLEDVVITEQEK